MAVSQQDIDDMKSVLDTEITNIKQQLTSLRGDIVAKTSNADFQKLQQTVLNDLNTVSKMFDDFGVQFEKHVTGPHAEISTRLAALEKEAAEANGQRQELHQRLVRAETSMTSSSISTSVPAERQIAGAKLNVTYDQENGKISFEDWSHKLKVYMTSMFVGAHKTLIWASTQKDRIELNSVPAVMMTAPDVSRLAETLYSVLSSQTEGEALKIVKAEESSFNGLEAWRRLVNRFAPRSAVKGYLMKSKLHQPQPCPSMEKVRDAILAWESEVRRYTDMSGKNLDDDDKIGALIQIVPPQVQNHIRLNPEKAEAYDDLRKLIFSYAAAVEESKPQPMDLGSFQQSQKANFPPRGNWSKGGKGSSGKSSQTGFSGYTNWKPQWKGGKSKGKGKSLSWSYRPTAQS